MKDEKGVKCRDAGGWVTRGAEAEASGEDTFADVPRDTWETSGRSVHPVHDWPSLSGFW